MILAQNSQTQGVFNQFPFITAFCTKSYSGKYIHALIDAESEGFNHPHVVDVKIRYQGQYVFCLVFYMKSVRNSR